MSKADEVLALVVGEDIKPLGLTANFQTFVFTPIQMNFIKNLEKLKSIPAACISVGWHEQTGRAFLNSRKFQKYLGCRMQAISTKAAMGAEAWWQVCADITNGFKKKLLANCVICKTVEEITPYEYELSRHDDLNHDYRCPVCGVEATVEEQITEFKPSREQVEGWKEWGARITPKIERTHHTFENTEIVFSPEGETNG